MSINFNYIKEHCETVNDLINLEKDLMELEKKVGRKE